MYPKLSIAIISFNEEHIIGKMLESIKYFPNEIIDEIIIVDSNSTDNTVQIASNYTNKIFIEDWKGFVAQKNSALEKCSSDWILFLDCDELLTKELAEEISNKIQNSDYDGYKINRRTYYLNKVMKHSWQPDWNLRLVNKKSNPKWLGYDIHEKLSIDSENIGTLKNEILHYSYKNIRHHFEKTLSYSKQSADEYSKNGKIFRISNLLINPITAFIKMYFLRLGILDGVPGFIAAFSSFYGTLMKYIFLFENSQKK